MSHIFIEIFRFNTSDNWIISPAYSTINKIHKKETSMHLLLEAPDDLSSVIH